MEKTELLLTPLQHSQNVVMGADPEFFFEKEGKIIGAEKILNLEKGLDVDITGGASNSFSSNYSKFIVDGVQAELNPKPDTCRARLGNEFSNCFKKLYNEISKYEGTKINFNTTIEISDEELKSLNENSRRFGCAPSFNSDKKSRNAVSLKDPSKYLYRSAGGHIHLGYKTGDSSQRFVMQLMKKEPERIIAILDIIVGNTCVLIDRNPGNKERRKVYGKAGEYRTPEHGIEYRTLSNFWLRSYQLMSFVMGLSRYAFNIIYQSKPWMDYEKELLSLVNMKKIKRAINNNDFNLAWENFQDIKDFLNQTSPIEAPFGENRTAAFEHFATKGLDYWFKDNPIDHWRTLEDGHNGGWESFANTIVKKDMLKSRTINPKKIKLKKK